MTSANHCADETLVDLRVISECLKSWSKPKSKTCEHAGSGKLPRFNFEGKLRGRFCAQHKKQGMVYVKHKKKCEQDGCSRQVLYNYQGEQRGRFCARHKLRGMAQDAGHGGCAE